MNKAKAAILITLFSATAFTAHAAPGPKVLTAGTAKERTAMTAGVSHKVEKGVNIFRGSPALLGAAKAPQVATPGIVFEMAAASYARTCAKRTFRRLRTQGFYSGNPYRTRRYTQGFYSGNN